MKLFGKRLFISDLPPNLTEDDIKDRFSKFGKITSIEIKHRKNITTKNKYPRYAFINLDIESNKLQKCFDDFQRNKWKGNYVELQVAKENFLEKLKKERENNKTKSNDEKVILVSYPFVNGALNKKNFSNSTIDVYDDETPPSKKTRKLSPNSKNIFSCSDLDLQCKNNENQISTAETKVINNDINIDTTTSEVATEKTETLLRIAEQKRLNSINEMKKSYQKQKSLLKLAFINVDTTSNNKIIFDDNDKHDIDHISNCQKDINSEKKTLFEDDIEEDEIHYNFEVKEQFQGKKGKKLMELQTKFKNDKRFMMDERFVEDGSSEDEEQNVNEPSDKHSIDPEKQVNNEIEITIEEKQKELSILEDVLGKKLVKNKDKDSTNKKAFKAISMTRYDPTKPDHTKYILKDEKIMEKRRKKEGELEQNTKRAQEVEKPVVSKETFYEVKQNLKEALQEDKSFSLLNMFGSHDKPDNKTVNNSETQDNKMETKENFSKIKDKNPFKYDSSEESEDDEQLTSLEQKGDDAKNENVSLGPVKLWTESFFFKDDDYRLQEGIDFVTRFEIDDKSEFKQVRRNIKEIVRAKVKNNQRKNRPFRKKLGGKRMIKIRKAMKNR